MKSVILEVCVSVSVATRAWRESLPPAAVASPVRFGPPWLLVTPSPLGSLWYA